MSVWINSPYMPIALWEFYQVVGNFQLPAGHNWYDIEAVAPGSPGDDDVRAMFQTMLEDQFKLRVHRETRELSGYDLVVAKNGPKLKAAQPDIKMTMNGKLRWATHCRGTNTIALAIDGNRLVGRVYRWRRQSNPLSRRLAAPVRDRTGLTVLFDYNVLIAPPERRVRPVSRRLPT